jgi:hypothetical protein
VNVLPVALGGRRHLELVPHAVRNTAIPMPLVLNSSWLKPQPYREIKRRLEAAGFVEANQKGSHVKFDFLVRRCDAFLRLLLKGVQHVSRVLKPDRVDGPLAGVSTFLEAPG